MFHTPDNIRRPLYPEATESVQANHGLAMVGNGVVNCMLEELVTPVDVDTSYSFYPEPAYDRYLKMNKTLAEPGNVTDLLRVYDTLKNQTMHRYLTTAGWAAAEAGLMGYQLSTSRRLELIDGANDCWSRAITIHRTINERSRHHLAEPTQPLRLAMDMAVTPLLKGIIESNVTEPTCRQAFENCLAVAKFNRQLCHEARASHDIPTMQDHAGFSYECNALLAINRQLSSTRFAIPALSRSDSGQYLPDQTHDLLAIHQQWGNIRTAIPIEIKGKMSGSDRRRYKALLVGGRTHLQLEGYSADETLDLFDTAYREPHNHQANMAANALTGQVVSMIRDYCAGEELAVAESSATSFRNSRIVRANHPGKMPLVFHGVTD
jgi:hypothetical protein